MRIHDLSSGFTVGEEQGVGHLKNGTELSNNIGVKGKIAIMDETRR